jgi:hypothetical protein
MPAPLTRQPLTAAEKRERKRLSNQRLRSQHREAREQEALNEASQSVPAARIQVTRRPSVLRPGPSSLPTALRVEFPSTDGADRARYRGLTTRSSSEEEEEGTGPGGARRQAAAEEEDVGDRTHITVYTGETEQEASGSEREGAQEDVDVEGLHHTLAALQLLRSSPSPVERSVGGGNSSHPSGGSPGQSDGGPWEDRASPPLVPTHASSEESSHASYRSRRSVGKAPAAAARERASAPGLRPPPPSRPPRDLSPTASLQALYEASQVRLDAEGRVFTKELASLYRDFMQVFFDPLCTCSRGGARQAQADPPGAQPGLSLAETTEILQVPGIDAALCLLQPLPAAPSQRAAAELRPGLPPPGASLDFYQAQLCGPPGLPASGRRLSLAPRAGTEADRDIHTRLWDIDSV